MKAGYVKRGLAMAILLVCVVALPGQASADHIGFTVQVTSVTEGEANVILTIELTTPAPEDTSLSYTTADGTALAGSDYTTTSGSAPFAAGAKTTDPITVPVLDDELDEDNEAFTVAVTHGSSPPVPATIADDNDTPPTVSIAGPTDNVPEGTIAQFPVTLSGPSGRPVEVRYQTLPFPSDDFDGTTNGSITIMPPATTGTIEVETNDVNGNKTFTVTLNQCGNDTCTRAPPTNASATIQDDAPPPTVSIADTQVGEGARNPDTGNVELRFTLSLSAASTQPVTVRAETQDGVAKFPEDYQYRNDPAVTVAAGQTEQSFVVVVNDDLLDEPNETMTVVLSNAVGAVIGRAVATGTIVDNGTTSALEIDDPEADEPGSMSFTVTLAPASKRTVTVDYATMDDTAAAGSDYTPASGTLTFQPDQTTQTVTVPVLGDAINENHETVVVNLVNPSGARITDAKGEGRIIDKNAPPSLSISDTVSREGGGASFTVELAGTTLREVTVGFSTGDGSAREPGDYAARRGTLTFAPGEKTKTLVVTVVDDTLAETVETFSVTISDVVNGAITKSRGTATIEASDQVGTSPSGSPLRPTTPPASPTLLPKMVLAPRTVNVTKTGFARLFLTCTKLSPIACRGSITLQTTGKPAVKLGSKTFLVAKGKKKTLGVKLSPRARKLLAKRPTLRARVVVLVKTGKKSLRVVPGVITLKAAPKSPKPKSPKKNTAPKNTAPKVTVRP